MLRVYASILSLLLLCSCGGSKLYTRKEQVDRSQLASSVVDTPDILEGKPYLGQRLIIGWYLSQKDFQGGEVLKIYIRYGNRELEEKLLPVTKAEGHVELLLLNEKFKEKKGFSSYLIKLEQEGKTLLSWQHQLWVDPVELKDE